MPDANLQGDTGLNPDRTEQAMDPTNRLRPEGRADSKKKGKKPKTDSLLEMEESEAAKKALKDWDKSWKPIKRFIEQWKVNRARSEGYTGVQLVKRQDQAQAYIPVGAKKNVAGMNKASRLSRRIRATLFGDPPKPEAMPSGDTDEHKDAAEMATRVLEDLCSEGKLGYNLDCGDAFDMGGDYGSGFLRFWVDETGGGWQPKQLMASPQAVSANDPFPVDPQTGVERPCDPILRFVTEDGQFTDDRAEAERVWLPRIKIDGPLSGKQVRFLPADADDIWAADGVQIGLALTLGEVKAIFPEVEDWGEDRISKLVQYRPQYFKDSLSAGQKDTMGSSTSDESLVFVLTRYHVQSPTYPEGAYLIIAGDDEVLHRSTWWDEEHAEPLDIPLTQFKQRNEEGNPYGEGNMSALGPGNELRSAMVGAMLEHLDRFQNRQIYLPLTSTLKPQDQLAPTGTVQYILPGGEPKFEEIPDFPVVVKETLQFASQDMDDESDLQQAGQGQNAPNVKSAKHQEVNLQQINQAMSDLKQNTERGLTRGYRIVLQLVRAHYTQPQQIGWVGDDGRYKQKHWTAADLGSTKDVRIAKGSFTQLTPMSKAQLAQVYREQGLLNPMEAEHVVESNLNPIFGLEDNPHRMRVRRQIALWQEGPKGPPAPPVAPTAPVGAPPAGPPGAPPQPPPNPYQAELAPIFAPVPADTEPMIAMLRMYELGRAMASTKFQKHPPAWQQGMVMSYQAARQAAQIPDAKVLQGLQQQVQELQKENLDQKVKLNAASVSISLKGADLDENQTVAILGREGIQLPPRTTPVPGPVDPKEQLGHQLAIETAKIAADVDKHKTSTQADVEKEKIRQLAKGQQAEAQRQHSLKLAQTLRSQKPKKRTITKKGDSYEVTE